MKSVVAKGTNQGVIFTKKEEGGRDMRLRFTGKDGFFGLKTGSVYEVIVSAKYGEKRICAQFKPFDEWIKYGYSSLASFTKDWTDPMVV